MQPSQHWAPSGRLSAGPAADEFLVDQIDVHCLLTGRLARFAQVEISTVNGNAAYMLVPDIT